MAADDLASVVKVADVWDNTDPARVIRLSQSDRARLSAKCRHTLQVLAESAGPVEPWTLVLRDIEVNGIHSVLTVNRDADGTVRFCAQDLGVPAGLMSSDTEYEYFRTVRPRHVPQLVDLLADDRATTSATSWARSGRTTSRSPWRSG